MRWIVFGEDWASHPSSTQHLFKRLMAKDQVVWVNSMGLRAPRLNRHDLTRAGIKLKAMLQNSGKMPGSSGKMSESSGKTAEPAAIETDIEKPAQLIQPRCLPFYRSRLVRRFNRNSLQRQITKATAQLQPTTDSTTQPRILWLSLPSAADLIGQCQEDLSVYYCGDDFSALAGVDHQIISRMETELAQRCDLILTASDELAKKFPPEKTHVLQHGVDYQQFARPQAKPNAFPQGRVMGFYGQLADWVDIELLKQLADHYPDWTLMLIGAIHTDTSDLLQRDNVLWLDAMPHQQLAAYCQHWDLALLPFKACEQISHCNPLKLKEYLASGTPVVSLRFPAAEQYACAVTLADSASGFLPAVGRAMHWLDSASAEEKTSLCRLQRSLVQPESWEHKVSRIEQLVTRHLSGQPAGRRSSCPSLT